MDSMTAQRPMTTPWGDAPGADFLAGESATMGFFKPGTAAGSPPRKKNPRKNHGNLRPMSGLSASTGSLHRPMSGVTSMTDHQASQSQSSTFGRSSSASQLKKGLAKLPPLPKQPLTFENLYAIAKKRATTKMTEDRQAATLKPTGLSPPSSRIGTAMSKPLTAMMMDIKESPEEKAWASDTLTLVPSAEESAVADRELGIAAISMTDQTESRASSKRRLSRGPSKRAAEELSASQELSAQMGSTTEGEREIPQKRDTREQAAEVSRAYIQALRQLMDSDESNFGNINNIHDTLQVAAASLRRCESQRSDNGFTDDDMKRMRVAFNRFKGAEGEIHQDDLCQALSFLGYMKVTKDICKKIAGEITNYSMLDWADYSNFIEKFQAFERDEFFTEFSAMDEDGSGQLSLVELRALISGLGVTPFRETLEEAMAVVDFDGSGQLDFDEFVHLMSVYRVTEGFSREEVKQLKMLFDRVAVPVPGGPKEVKPDRLVDVLTRLFGPQSIQLATRLARRFVQNDHSEPCPEKEFKRQSIAIKEEDHSPHHHVEDHSDLLMQPGLPFPEFLVWARRLREAEIVEFRKQFNLADLDDSGVIAADEIRQVITMVGYMPLKAIVAEVLGKVDVDGDASLDFDEFVNLMQVFRKTDGFCAAEIEELTEVFQHYKTGEENVDCMELMEILRSMGYVTNLDHTRRFIKQVDFDNSNSLDLPEFIRLMRMHREQELNQALETFNEEKDSITGNLMQVAVETTLNKLSYHPTEEMLADSLNRLIDVEQGVTEPPQELDFDAFVNVMDVCRKASVVIRRMHAGYSDDEVNRYKEAFGVYDEDGNGDIERHELTNLLNDLGIPMRSKEEQKKMLEQLDVARNKAAEAGVTDELLGNMGDPSVTFNVLLFLVRMLHNAADQAEVERDRMIMEKTNFSPKEAEEFREIFAYWSVKAAALDGGEEAPHGAGEARPGSPIMGGDHAPEEVARNQFLTVSGMGRVVRSIGLHMAPQDRRDLDDKLEAGPTSSDHPGKYGFFEFLMFMRWMMNTNFCNINEIVALAAAVNETED